MAEGGGRARVGRMEEVEGWAGERRGEREGGRARAGRTKTDGVSERSGEDVGRREERRVEGRTSFQRVHFTRCSDYILYCSAKSTKRKGERKDRRVERNGQLCSRFPSPSLPFSPSPPSPPSLKKNLPGCSTPPNTLLITCPFNLTALLNSTLLNSHSPPNKLQLALAPEYVISASLFSSINLLVLYEALEVREGLKSVREREVRWVPPRGGLVMEGGRRSQLKTKLRHSR